MLYLSSLLESPESDIPESFKSDLGKSTVTLGGFMCKKLVLIAMLPKSDSRLPDRPCILNLEAITFEVTAAKICPSSPLVLKSASVILQLFRWNEASTGKDVEKSMPMGTVVESS